MNDRWRILTCAATCLLSSLLATAGWVDAEEVARYDLAFCSYRVGMSFDEAAAVRPIQRIDMVRQQPDDQPVLLAFVDTIRIDDIDLRFQLSFVEERLFKVIARFSPLQFDDLHRQFETVYGTAEDLSRVVETYDGSTRRQSIYRWDFPGVRIFLQQSSANLEFATASLHARDSGTPVEPAPEKIPPGN